ncbi:uncharacterized protein [Mobula birostris]|uniref:uncharacterized protein isoform X2 n=1 Tax=Mobula birostris TaxID=1983395 RepID=UPI003B2836C1
MPTGLESRFIGREQQKLITSVLKMAQGASRGGVPVTSTSRKNTGPSSEISELLAGWDDSQLLQLTDFYRDRLEQAMEEGVHGVSLALTAENQFSGEEHRKISDLADKGERADGSKLLLSLVMEKGSRARRVMWETFVKMRIGVPKLDKILKEIKEHGCVPVQRPVPEIPRELKDVQQKHKETLRAQTETLRVNRILMREEVEVFQLADRYAELTVISTVRDRTLVEHELLARGRDHEEWREKHLRRELEKIRTDQLFQSSFSRSKFKSGSSAAVAGVAGIGKTTMVQKIVYDWATGKIYQQFQFVFSFKFRDLNSINCRINLKELILDQYPHFKKILREVWKNPEGLLFIFDGLDEFNDKIDFADSQRNTEPRSTCTDPEFNCKVSDIVYSLIQGKLLPGCSVLVTYRPTALGLLEKAEINVRAEILGFVGEERKEYFTRHFEDQTVAAAVFKHVKENEILYTMSYNPSCCWILALALGPFFTQRVRDPQRVPKTITQLYCYYIYNILKNHGREIENPRDVLLRVGQMAFRGVAEKKIVFTDGDLIKYNLQPSQFLSGFLMELLEREDSAQSVVYTFPHITIQEFVAAVAQFLNPHPGDSLRFLTEAHSTTDSRFEVFLRFVAGLSNPMTARGLEEFLGPFPHQTTCRVIDWVKEEVKRQSGNTWNEAGKRSLLNTLHYLFESQNRGLAQAALRSVETLSFSGMTLTPFDCAVLDHVIGLCDTIKYLNLEDCHSQCEAIQRLGPGLHKCQELSLGWNKLEDSGVKLVSAALRKPECKIQKLWLRNVGLTDSGAEDLASALRTNSSLTELNLSANKLGDSGVKRVSAALRNPKCKLQKLWLSDVGLTANGAKDLISTLSTNRSLKELSLNDNKLGDSGVKLLSAALRDSECNIQKLWLRNVGLTDSGVEDLASALSTNPSLTELNLSANELGDSGVKLVSAALTNSKFCIQKLWLSDVGLTANGAKDLISTLSTNRSLKELSLNDNKLGDSGVKLLSAALRDSECNIQKLCLWNVGLTDSGAGDLNAALGGNPSLTVLNLNNNKLEDSGVKLVSAALKKSRCKLQELRLRNVGLTDSGAKDLASTLRTNRSLMELNLNDNKLGDSGVKLVSAALKKAKCKIQKLWLRDVGLTDSGAKDLASALSSNPSLTELNLGANKLGDSGVKLVSAALKNSECKIQKLWLYDVGLTDSGAKDLNSTLSTNQSLTELSLNDNKLGDSGVKLVSEALKLSECKIQKLSLRNVGLTDSGVEDLLSALRTNPSLTELNLSGNKLGDSGVKLVSEALRNSECKIQKLCLYDVGLTDSGAKDLASTLSTNRSLTELNLNDNELGDSGVKLVSEALRNSKCEIQKLWLRDVGLTDSGAEDLASALRTNPSLTELNLGANKLGDSGMKLVSAALRNTECKIQKLWLYDVGLTANGAKEIISTLSTNRSLKELSLNDNKLGDSGVKLVSDALRVSECKIQKLWLRDVGLTDSGVEDLVSALSTNPKLTELNLSYNKLGDSGVKLVSAALKNSDCKIQKLWLMDVGLTDSAAGDFVSALSTKTSLMVLSLNNNKLRDSGVKLVSAALMKSRCKLQELGLRDVGLTDSGAGDLASALRTNPSLTELNLNDNQLGDSGVKLLSAALGNPECKLQKLQLDNIGLTDSGAKDLASALSTNPSLTELNLSVNKLGDSGMKLVSEALRNSKCEIQKLWLYDVGLTANGAKEIISTLSTNRSLKELSLNDNKLGDSGVKLVSDALRVSECKIQKLWLRDVGLTDSGVEDLVSALSTNPKLTELNLSYNKLGDSGVKLVSAALKNSDCKIQKLWLMDVGLTDSAAGDFVSALSTKTSLMVLSLNNNKLRDSGVKLVSAALMKSRCKLQELGLRDVGLTDSGAGDLASALRTNPSLTELNLNDNLLGDSGVKLLSAALGNPECKLQKLQLDNIGLTDSGAKDLASALSTNPSLTELNLSVNKLGDSGVKLVSEALRNPECKIQKLGLRDVGLTDSGAGDLASALRTNPSLTELNLNDNQLGDSGVKLLSAALGNPECKLQKLQLDNIGLTDSGAKDLVSALSTNPKLTELNLSYNKLGDSGVKLVSAALKNSDCKIQKLWLMDVGLTDSAAGDFVSALSTKTSLMVLSLNNNKLRDSGVKLVSAALMKSRCKLQELGLRDVGLTDSGAGDLASALRTNPSLTELNLNDNLLGDSGVKLLSAALGNPECKLQKLQLDNIGLTDSGAKDLASALSTNPSLTELNLSVNKLGDSGVKLVSEALRNPECKIQKLGLRDVGLTDSGAGDLASALRTNPSLTELNLNDNQLGDSGVKLLSAALGNPECKLQKLQLDNIGLTDSGAKDLASALSTNPSLTELNLSVNKLGDSGVKLVSEALRNSKCEIQKLWLRDVGLTDSGAEDLASALRTNPSLTELNLGANKLGDSGMKLVSAALRNTECKIQKLWLDNIGLTDSGAKDLVSALSTNPKLTELNLSYNKLGDSGVKLVSAALKNSDCKIQKLWLMDVRLTDSAAGDFVSALSTKTSLMVLSLNNNKLQDSGVKLVSAALMKSRCKLQELGLRDVGLTDSGAGDLASALRTNPSLTELNLNDNQLGDSGVKLLSVALGNPECKLQKLQLDNIGLTDSGAKDLASALSTNPSLTELNLSVNKLGDSGVKLVSEALRNSKCEIQKLWLRDVGLTDSGAEDLASALRTNPSLTELNLGANKLGDSGMKLVSAALRNTECKIQKLWLDNIGLTDSGAKDLVSALSTNPKLTELNLSYNKLGDSGVKLVSAALKNSDCKIQKLWLMDVGLTDSAAGDFVSALSTKTSLMVLSLNNNKLRDSGVKLVSAALMKSRCKLQELGLRDVGLTDSGAGDLASALRTNPSLTELNLNDNLLGDSGVKLLSAALGNPECKLQKLQLDNIGLTDSGAKDLASALSTNPSLTELNLSVNKLGDSGVKLVSEALRNPECKIQKLGLRDVGLTDSGAGDLASALRTNPSLTELNLNDNQLGDSGVKLLSAALGNPECKLQKLQLDNIGLTDSGAKDLASALSTNPSLTELNLSVNKLGDSGVKLVSEALRNSKCEIQKLWLRDVGLTDSGAEDLASALRTNPSLTELNLGANKLGDSGMKLVSAALRNTECKIQKLWLMDVGLTDSAAGDFVSALSTKTSLMVLSLNNNKLRDSGVKLVSAALMKSRCKLQELGLRDVGLTDSGAGDLASALRTNPSLTELNLNDNLLGDSGVKLLSAALGNPECKLQKLQLDNIGLTDSGAKDLASALSTNPSLTELNLSVNKLGDSGVKLVSEALRNPECKIQKLGLRDVGLTDSGAGDLASALRTNPSLTELNLNDNQLGDSGVKLLSAALGNPECKLQKLQLDNIGLTDSGAKDLASALSTNPSLTELNLSVNKLGDSGVKLVSEALRNSKCEIQKLWLRDVGLTDSGAEDLASALRTNPSLTELNLGANKLGDSGMKLVSAALRNTECKIQKLWLMDVGLTDSAAGDFVSALSTKTSLMVLSLNNNKLRDSGVKLVSAALMKSRCKLQELGLRDVGLTDSGAGDLASALRTNPSLTELNLNDNLLGDSGVKLLSAALGNPECKLQKLQLDNIGLTDSGAKDLASALSTNPSLTELNLSVNKLGDSGVKLVSEALRNPECKIQKLGLRDVGLTDSGAGDLASALRTNPSLTELNLNDNQLGDSGVKLLSAALGNPECKLQKLQLDNIGLTDSGAKDLASALSTNPSLTELNLSVNKLGDSGVKLVSAALMKSRCKLQELGLDNVGLTDSGAEDLVSALSTNPSLTELNLGYNSLTDRSVPALRRLILTLPSLEQIRLWDNRFSETGEKELRSLQEPRPGLTVICEHLNV